MSSNPLFDIIVCAYRTSKTVTVDRISDLLLHGPNYYSEWWISLLRESPEHLVIETGLVIFILWIIFIRRTVDPSKSSKNPKLTKKEEQWLVDTWQPDPIVPKLTNQQQRIVDSSWVIESVDGQHLRVRGVSAPVLNLASFDFLGLSLDLRIKHVAKEALEFYGVGSCGPRGFYGTIDQHLFFEQAIAKFMGTQEAISYSDGASTVSSAIPAFSKKGDLLLADEAVSEPILTGLNLSRSTVLFFRHNDMDHLRSILQSIANDDKRLKRDTSQQRRFIVVEGLYRNTGDICPLPEILALKEQFFYRLILDESVSFGALGRTGRGVTEHYGVKVSDVEVMLLAMDTALASVGGVCIGSREIVDHQRLSGAGYCFSASAPPFLSAAACEALKIIEDSPALMEVLHANTGYLHKSISDKVDGLQLRCSVPTPIMNLTLSTPLDSLEEEAAKIIDMSNYCVAHGVGIVASKFSMLNSVSGMKYRPSLTLCASTKLTSADMDHVVATLAAASMI